jgi:ketosteroid isomerase-like protein
MLPDVRWRTSGDNPFAGESKSAADFLTLLASFAEAVDDLRMELCDIFASDRGAVLHYQAVAERGPDLLECEYLILMHIEDGLIVDAVTIALDTDRNDAFWRKAAAARSG